MALKVAFQMDPIERIDIRGDSTFALLLEAQWRGHDVFYYTPNNLSLRDGQLIAEGHSLTVEDKPENHYRLAHPREVDLATFDVVHLRQDPPFDMAYITTTHLLERIHPDGPDIVAQARFAVTDEWATTTEDILRRRTTVALRGLADEDAVRRAERVL